MSRTIFSIHDVEASPAGSGGGRTPLEPGKYKATLLDSRYENTKTEVIVDGKGDYIRRVYDYSSSTNAPLTTEERNRGADQTNSGTYIYILVECEVEGWQWPKKVPLRFNLTNVIADPWSGRGLFRQLLCATGLETVPLEVGQSVEALHGKSFMVELSKKQKRNGSPGEMENEAVAIEPLTPQRPRAEVVDVVSSGPRPSPPASAFNDEGMF